MAQESIFEEVSGGAGAVTPPPRSRRFRRDKTAGSSPQRPQRSDKELRSALVKFFSETAPGIAQFAGDEYDAHIVQLNAARLADAYAELAKASPRFRALLEGILSAGGPLAAAVFATAAVAIPILHHHRVISLPPLFGLALIGEPLEAHPVHAEENGHPGADTSPAGESPGTTANAV